MKTLQELRESQWNGKVYGRREYNSCNIYLDGNKVSVSNEEADYLESLDEDQAVWYKFEKLTSSVEVVESTLVEKDEKISTFRQESKLKKRADRNNTPYWADEELSECYGY